VALATIAFSARPLHFHENRAGQSDIPQIHLQMTCSVPAVANTGGSGSESYVESLDLVLRLLYTIRLEDLLVPGHPDLLDLATIGHKTPIKRRNTSVGRAKRLNGIPYGVSILVCWTARWNVS